MQLTVSSRTRLLESPIALVEDLRSPSVGAPTATLQFSPRFQVCLPYRGLFIWHVGSDEVVGDANQVLYVAGGESFHLSQPAPLDYAELIITPDPALLEEVAAGCGAAISRHPLFRRRSRRVGFDLQRLRAHFLQAAWRADVGELEEWTVRLLRVALENSTGGHQPGAATRRLIRRAKEFLDANLAAPVRLMDVARAAGASPAYLTDVFRRVEGIPLHRYLTQLRLARALVELRDSDDLTTLALDLGFSSHSHFTAAFRRAFGCTPSRFRELSRARPFTLSDDRNNLVARSFFGSQESMSGRRCDCRHRLGSEGGHRETCQQAARGHGRGNASHAGRRWTF